MSFDCHGMLANARVASVLVILFGMQMALSENECRIQWTKVW